MYLDDTIIRRCLRNLYNMTLCVIRVINRIRNYISIIEPRFLLGPCKLLPHRCSRIILYYNRSWRFRWIIDRICIVRLKLDLTYSTFFNLVTAVNFKVYWGCRYWILVNRKSTILFMKHAPGWQVSCLHSCCAINNLALERIIDVTIALKCRYFIRLTVESLSNQNLLIW